MGCGRDLSIDLGTSSDITFPELAIMSWVLSELPSHKAAQAQQQPIVRSSGTCSRMRPWRAQGAQAAAGTGVPDTRVGDLPPLLRLLQLPAMGTRKGEHRS